LSKNLNWKISGQKIKIGILVINSKKAQRRSRRRRKKNNLPNGDTILGFPRLNAPKNGDKIVMRLMKPRLP
jgi:hypothetical protein